MQRLVPGPVRAAATAAAAVLLLAACGDPVEPAAAAGPVPVAAEAVGGYRLTTEITDSTLPDNPVGAESKVSTTAFLSCADDPCTTLLQRAASTERPQGNTTRLTPGPGGFTGEHIRIGECGGTSHGSYGEAFTWTWRRGDDGVLTGTLKQVFQGCGIDGSTTFAATATPEPDLELPYLDAGAADLIAAINAYDVNLAAVYVAGSNCDATAGSTTVAEADCFSSTFAGWQQDVDALRAPVEAARRVATGACREALTALGLPSFSGAIGKAATLYAAATGPATIRTALKAEEAATQLATAQHARLITVAALCTDPRDVASLGTNGLLDLDQASVLPPLDDLS